MSPNPAARAARKVAEEQRKAELDAISKRAYYWMATAKTTTVALILTIIMSGFIIFELKQPWYISEPPADQPVRLVVICYKGKDGVWKSYAEGHPVQPAKEWMWKPVWRP